MDDEARWQEWQRRIRANYIGLEFRPLEGFGGWCDHSTITINPNQTTRQMMAICVHELGHWYLHFGPQLDIVDPEQIRPSLTRQRQEFEAQLVVRYFYTELRRNWTPPYPTECHTLTYDEAIDIFKLTPFEFYSRRARLAVNKVWKLLEG